MQTNQEWHLKWFYPESLRWEDLLEDVRTKVHLVNVYSNHDNSFHNDGITYDDYSEFLVEQAFLRTGFRIEGRHTRRYNGHEAVVRDSGAGRPPDLDLIVHADEHTLGVQVKNRLDYPEAQSIRDCLSICDQLNLTPLLIVPMASEKLLGQVTANRGRVIVFKRWLLRPPFPRDTFDQMLRIGIPAAVYTRVPDFLISKIQELRRSTSR